MNIGSGLFNKSARNIAATAISFVFATTAVATPNQLDVLGLVPGVSELPQVIQAGDYSYSLGHSSVKLEIGGHRIPCSVDFRNDKLDRLTCFTGEDKHRFTEASNTQVHSTLTEGFTKKFGKPNSVIRDPVRTGMGVTYEQIIVTWKDKQGNILKLELMFDNVNTGAIFLQSAAYLKQLAADAAAAEAKKKF